MKIIPSKTQDFKADFERYTAKAALLIHAQQTSETIANMVRQGSDPVLKVAQATTMIMQRMDAATRQAGVEIQDAIKIFCAVSIVNDITDILDAATGVDLNDELTQLAVSVAVQDYIKDEIKAGRMDAQKVKVGLARDMRRLPPKERKMIQQSQPKLQQIARKYNHGKGLDKFSTKDNNNPEKAPLRNFVKLTQEALEKSKAPAPGGLINTAKQEV